MKLLLINPSKYDENGVLMKFQYGTFPPLSLMILASLVKEIPDVRTRIVDEFIEDIPWEEDFDLAAVSTLFTSSFPRVVDIAGAFRKKGVPVVLGGTHATCNHGEALKHADAVVSGEAENSFPRLIDDFLSGRGLKKIYKGETCVDLEKAPVLIPRYDFVDLGRYIKTGFFKKTNMFQIESSRGCPMNCIFCTVRYTHGTALRHKAVSSVIEEVRFLKKNYGARFFSFADDNFLFHYERSKNLLTELARENIGFFCEVSTRVLDKPDLVPLLKKAGCVSALIGVESVNPDVLASVKKTHNKVAEYNRLFELFEKHRVPALASFIFGFDSDDENSFSGVLKLLKQARIQRAVFNILTPFPGTGLYQQYQSAGRILEKNLSLYDICHVIFKPVRMTKQQIEEGFWRIYRKFYSMKEIIARILKARLKDMAYLFFANLRFRGLVYKKSYPYSSGVKRIS